MALPSSLSPTVQARCAFQICCPSTSLGAMLGCYCHVTHEVAPRRGTLGRPGRAPDMLMCGNVGLWTGKSCSQPVGPAYLVLFRVNLCDSSYRLVFNLWPTNVWWCLLWCCTTCQIVRYSDPSPLPVPRSAGDAAGANATKVEGCA